MSEMRIAALVIGVPSIDKRVPDQSWMPGVKQGERATLWGEPTIGRINNGTFGECLLAVRTSGELMTAVPRADIALLTTS